MAPLWKDILRLFDEAERRMGEGDLRGRFAALCRAQTKLRSFDEIMRGALPEAEDLLLLDDALLQWLELANVTGEMRYVRQARSMARQLGDFWAEEGRRAARRLAGN